VSRCITPFIRLRIFGRRRRSNTACERFTNKRKLNLSNDPLGICGRPGYNVQFDFTAYFFALRVVLFCRTGIWINLDVIHCRQFRFAVSSHYKYFLRLNDLCANAQNTNETPFVLFVRSYCSCVQLFRKCNITFFNS